MSARRPLSSADPGQDRALASDAQEPHHARALLPARRSRTPGRVLRGALQPCPLSREPRQSYPGRRLLRGAPGPSSSERDRSNDKQSQTVACSIRFMPHNLNHHMIQSLPSGSRLYVSNHLTSDIQLPANNWLTNNFILEIIQLDRAQHCGHPNFPLIHSPPCALLGGSNAAVTSDFHKLDTSAWTLAVRSGSLGRAWQPASRGPATVWCIEFDVWSCVADD